MSAVTMNARVLKVPSNGQRRVADEINRRLGLATLAPPDWIASGLKGHGWEQTLLPLQMGGRPLWSPSTSAPVFYRNQVVTVHDIGFVDVPQYYAPRFAATYRAIVRQLAGRVRHIVTVSEFSRARICAEYGLGADEVTAIPLGVAAAFRQRDAAEITAVRAAHGLDEAPYLVAFSGADPRKNTEGILRAWAALGGERGEGQLVLFGRVSNSAVFGQAATAQALPGVVRVGGVSDDDLARLYGGATGLVFPSFYEGFGLPIIEAAASGAPVITSRGGAMEEVAPTDAMLIDPAQTDELAAAMLRALRSQPSAAEREHGALATRRFSWDAAAASYAAIFSRVFG